LIDLSKTERKSLPKMGDRNETFVNKAMDIAEQHPEMFPPAFLEEMRKDAQLLGGSNSMTLPLKRAPKRIRQRSRCMR
jgi:hypothetical protein